MIVTPEEAQALHSLWELADDLEEEAAVLGAVKHERAAVLKGAELGAAYMISALRSTGRPLPAELIQELHAAQASLGRVVDQSFQLRQERAAALAEAAARLRSIIGQEPQKAARAGGAQQDFPLRLVDDRVEPPEGVTSDPP